MGCTGPGIGEETEAGWTMIERQMTKKVVEVEDAPDPIPWTEQMQPTVQSPSGPVTPKMYIGWSPESDCCVGYRCECGAIEPTQIQLSGHELMFGHAFTCAGCGKQKIIGVDVQDAPEAGL